MVQGSFLCACAPKALKIGPSGRLRKSTQDVEWLTSSSFGGPGQVVKSPGGCLISAGQPTVISSAKTSSLLAVVVGSVSNYGYLVNKYLLAELDPGNDHVQSAFTLNDVSKAEPVSVATLVAFLFATLGPAGLLRKLRGFFALVIYDPSKAWVLAARSPGARATVIQARGPDGSLLLASEPSCLPAGSHSLQELQPGCFKLGWHSGPRRYVKPANQANASAAGHVKGLEAANGSATAATAGGPPGAVGSGGVKKTKRGKRGGKKHAAEAEQKSAERQKRLPGRHSLDALLATAAESGRPLNSLRHLVISEHLPTPKAADGGIWRQTQGPSSHSTSAAVAPDRPPAVYPAPKGFVVPARRGLDPQAHSFKPASDVARQPAVSAPDAGDPTALPMDVDVSSAQIAQDMDDRDQHEMIRRLLTSTAVGMNASSAQPAAVTGQLGGFVMSGVQSQSLVQDCMPSAGGLGIGEGHASSPVIEGPHDLPAIQQPVMQGPREATDVDGQVGRFNEPLQTGSTVLPVLEAASRRVAAEDKGPAAAHTPHDSHASAAMDAANGELNQPRTWRGGIGEEVAAQDAALAVDQPSSWRGGNVERKAAVDAAAEVGLPSSSGEDPPDAAAAADRLLARRTTALPLVNQQLEQQLPTADHESMRPDSADMQTVEESPGAGPESIHTQEAVKVGGMLRSKLAPIRTHSPTENSPTAAGPPKVGSMLRSSLAPVRTHSPTETSPTAAGRPVTSRRGRRFEDAENSPPLAGTSPIRNEVTQLTAGLLRRISGRSSGRLKRTDSGLSGRSSLKKSDSGLSLTSNSSQGSPGHSPSSSRRSPLGLLRHLAHATIRRGFASHSSPNLAGMDAPGDDSSDDLMHAVPEWARHHAYEPLMEPVREDASEGVNTPMGSLQDRNTWGTPRADNPLLRRSPYLPVGWRGIPEMGTDAGATPSGEDQAPASGSATNPLWGLAPHGGNENANPRQELQLSGGTTSGPGDEAWESMWNATPWDAALVGMTSMQVGGAHRASAEHPMGVGGWERGAGMSHTFSGQQQDQRAAHRATVSGGLQAPLQPTMRPRQMKRMNKSKSCNDLEHITSGLSSRGALLAFA